MYITLYVYCIMMSVTQNAVCNCEIKSILTYLLTFPCTDQSMPSLRCSTDSYHRKCRRLHISTLCSWFIAHRRFSPRIPCLVWPLEPSCQWKYQLITIHPSLQGLSARRCPMPSAPPFSTCIDPAPFCRECEFPLQPTPWCRPTILSMVFLSSSVPPSFQTSPPSPAYCPSFCICVQTSLAYFPWSVVPCSSGIALLSICILISICTCQWRAAIFSVLHDN